jgi:hypothetical protein
MFERREGYVGARLLQAVFVTLWLLQPSAAVAQNCVIISGTHDSAASQNCAMTGQAAVLAVVSKEFENSPEQDGTWRHQLVVEFRKSTTLFLAACGDGVVDVGGGPWPSGAVAAADKVARKNCVGRRMFKPAIGKWSIWVITSAEDTKFSLHPVFH